jgi:hypothetical protein
LICAAVIPLYILNKKSNSDGDTYWYFAAKPWVAPLPNLAEKQCMMCMTIDVISNVFL